MKNFPVDQRGSGEPPSVDKVIERISGALGAREWMNQLKVQSETVRTWRKRGKVPITQLAKAAELSGRPIEWFNQWEYFSEKTPTNFFAKKEKQVIQKSEQNRAQSAENSDANDYCLIPQLSVSTSAGGGQTIGDEFEIGRFAFRRAWIESKGLVASQLRVITARGRSMEPTVRDHDILLVDTAEQHKLAEGIYVIDYGGESKCKRLMPLVGGGLKIFSDNPEYPAEDVKPGAIDQVRLVGRVIWVGGER